ncbi:MAG TPA: hypothetical protein VM345_20070 [Acidimicrobiales bacterium]|jgi:hypothetical protein|nr:hypothetical protein [Acidimicrobiales bacterium]
MGALSVITLGDVSRALRRYRPVAIGLVILLAAFAILPKPESVEGALSDSASLLDSTRASAPGGAGSATSVPPAAPGVADSGAFAGTPAFSGSSPSFGPSGSFESFGGSTGGSSSGSADTSFPSSNDTPAFVFDGNSVDSDTTTTGAPLRIVGSTWASRQSGTPLAAQGVPSGTLPVGVRLTDDKRSYIRLAGDQKVLTLAEDPAGARSTNGPVVVQACQVTTANWKDGEAIPLDGAPPFDAGSCVLGKRNAETGTWTFDLASFPSPTDPRGFALVPGEGAGLDFQVAFKKGA